MARFRNPRPHAEVSLEKRCTRGHRFYNGVTSLQALVARGDLAARTLAVSITLFETTLTHGVRTTQYTYRQPIQHSELQVRGE